MPRKPKPKPPHPIHSGDVHEGDFHWHEHTHLSTPDKHAYETCLKALRGLHNNSEREQVLGNLIGTLLHENHIGGLSRLVHQATLIVNHYQMGTTD